ncbi:hypothetical protein [Bacillus benzoevorans]|uniref:Phage protein n=1 Tax=Bacillus benzoevorans TaxID=1456 RepID=A0A7X0HTB1_9BACI|nr:hypothetical protein [Bacillus benzoevorans]MBB6446467.1 hypothetical protein [Bacillus benzoevorans]
MKFTNKTANQLASKVGGTRFLLPLDLQYHAGEGDPAPSDPPADPPGGNNPGDNPPADPPQDPPKTFTQEELNNIAAKEAKKAQEKLLKQLGVEDFNNAREGLAKFKEWQESQKTEAQKQAEQLKQLEENYSKTSSENETLKAQLSAVKAGVNGDSVEDVVTLARNLVSEEVDMDQAIQKVLEKYPHFKAVKEPLIDEKKPSFSTGQHTKQPQSETDKWLNAFKF